MLAAHESQATKAEVDQVNGIRPFDIGIDIGNGKCRGGDAQQKRATYDNIKMRVAGDHKPLCNCARSDPKRSETWHLGPRHSA